MVNKGSNYLAWDVRADDFRDDAEFPQQLAFLLQYAVLAPSTHNSQPWSFEINQNRILLRPNYNRLLPVADIRRRLLHISLGAALENLLIASDYFGFSAQVDAFREEEPEAVQISFERCGSASGDSEHLLFAIPRRCTNRKPYEDRQVDPAFIEMVLDHSSQELRLDVITNPQLKSDFVDVMMTWNQQNFANPSFRKELARYKRHNLTRSSLGIPGFAMGFSTPFSLVAPYVIRHVNVMKSMGESMEHLLKQGTPAFVLLSTAQDERQDWLETGQRLQRVLLEAVRAGLQTAINAVPLDEQPLQDLLDISHRPQICLRLGYGAAADTHSPRLKVSEVCTL